MTYEILAYIAILEFLIIVYLIYICFELKDYVNKLKENNMSYAKFLSIYVEAVCKLQAVLEKQEEEKDTCKK